MEKNKLDRISLVILCVSIVAIVLAMYILKKTGFFT